MGRKGPFVGFVIACAAAMACNALTGIGDLAVDDDTGDAAPLTDAGATNDAPPVSDAASNDSATTIDTGPPPLCPSAGNSCIPVVPDGWDGPFLEYIGDVSTVPNCPPTMPINDDENVGDPVGTIDCEDCQCQPAKNETCTIALTEYDDTACTVLDSVAADSTVCQSTENTFDGGITATTAVSGGFCPPFVATQNPSDITWPSVARLCGRSDSFLGDGCASGQLCVPDGVQPFLQHTCIRQMHADADCPAPWTQKTTSYNNVADNRGCSTDGCSCDGPVGGTCAGMLHVFTASTGCTGASTTTKVPSAACVPVLITESAKTFTKDNVITAAGSCNNPSGNPTATGGVAGGDDVNTICCAP